MRNQTKRTIAQSCFILAFAVLLVTLNAVDAFADRGTAAYNQGAQKLSQGDLNGALSLFAQAARAERRNTQYANEYAVLRQIIQLRTNEPTIEDPAQWERIARTLHTYYAGKRLYGELLVIDEKLYDRLQTSSTAVMLAETHLALRDQESALETMLTLPEEQADAASLAVLGMLLAQAGRTDEASDVAAKIEIDDETGSGALYRLARMEAAIGNQEKTIEYLRICFERTMPSVLPSFKAHAMASSEFSRIVETPEFLAVLETESKVPESECSGGSSCSSCPRRGQCESSE